jgi:type III pantothenate kinase
MAATAIGALARYAPPLIIVDMGTATKMTVLDKNGSFIGGAIMPGVSLSMSALAAGTSLLPRVPIEAPPKCICANTVESMRSGATYGAASMIDGMTERFEAELGIQVKVIATGGLADAVYRHCKREVVHDPHLILHGLWIVYEKNRRTGR